MERGGEGEERVLGAESEEYVSVSVAAEASDELVRALRRLLPQLSPSASPPTREELAEIVASPATTVLIARDARGQVLGTLTLAVLRTPIAKRAWVEDVVVDERARGRGVGRRLTAEAIRLAREAGARNVDLTSREGRTAANRLYAKLGFGKRETNVYRLSLREG